MTRQLNVYFKKWKKELVMPDNKSVLEKPRKKKKEKRNDWFTNAVEANQEDDKKPGRNPSSDTIAAMLLGRYQGDLLYSKMHDQFFMYGARGPGLWAGLMEIEVKSDIKNKLDEIKGALLPRGYSMKSDQ